MTLLLTEVRAGHGNSIEQVVMHWPIQRGFVVVAKSFGPTENADAVDIALTDEQMAHASRRRL